MSREKLKEERLKVKLSIRINPELHKILVELEPNKSKYIEFLVYKDLLNKGKINEIML